MTHKLIKIDNYLLVVDNSEIKEGDWIKWSDAIFKASVDTEYLPPTKKIIAHLPLNGSAILEGVDLLPPYSRHQEDGLDAFAEYYWKMKYIMALDESTKPYIIEDFKAGYNKAREKYKYTENDIEIAMLQLAKYMIKGVESIADVALAQKAKSIVQSLHQYPTEFECEMKYFEVDMGLGEECIEHGQIPQKITTAQGVQWVGKYK